MKNSIEGSTQKHEQKPKDLTTDLTAVAEQALANVPDGTIYQKPKFSVNETYEIGDGIISIREINHTISYSITAEIGPEKTVDIVVSEPELSGLLSGEFVIDKVAHVGSLIELKKGVLVRTSPETGGLLCMIVSNDLEKGLLLEEVATQDKIRMKTKDTEVVFNKDGEVATEVDILKENI